MPARKLVMILLIGVLFSCNKSSSENPAVNTGRNISITAISVDGVPLANSAYNVQLQPEIKLVFNEPVQPASVAAAVQLMNGTTSALPVTAKLQQNDSVLLIKPNSLLQYLSQYHLVLTTALKSASGGSLITPADKIIITKIDSAPKFPLLTTNELLTLVQQKTFNYFWQLAHPVSGLARERNTSGDLVTTGGTGFGVMAIVTGIHRNFITSAQGLARLKTMVSFLNNKARKFHGAFPHWLNGSSGAVIPFSAKDDGADLVETAYLVMGLLTARQYFDGNTADEIALRADINTLCSNVEWNWFRKANENQLYWHWSENFGWTINQPIRGWNECLITYVLAAASATYGINAEVYKNGFTANGGAGFLNGQVYDGVKLPLGPAFGGPLFFAHYSFMGINPNGLSDVYANYDTQNIHHTLINYNYCKNNPKQFFGYSAAVWGLSASDIPGGYAASSPTNDIGVITPTAALSSMPYTPEESIRALEFYYYTLGDKVWKDYGFTDAFSLHQLWFADSYLAIDQGPILIMIENYRSKLLWNLFTSCPEVKTGMQTLGFKAPYLQ
jgi:hypothetical protein